MITDIQGADFRIINNMEKKYTEVSKLVFYAQSTSLVISGRRRRKATINTNIIILNNFLLFFFYRPDITVMADWA